MVLVSSPKRSICGISCGLGAPWGGAKGVERQKKRAATLWAGPPGRVVFACYLEYRGHQGDGKTPKALALVTACVRLWTLSLP
jgi:hypothetical protein